MSEETRRKAIEAIRTVSSMRHGDAGALLDGLEAHFVKRDELAPKPQPVAKCEECHYFRGGEPEHAPTCSRATPPSAKPAEQGEVTKWNIADYRKSVKLRPSSDDQDMADFCNYRHPSLGYITVHEASTAQGYVPIRYVHPDEVERRLAETQREASEAHVRAYDSISKMLEQKPNETVEDAARRVVASEQAAREKVRELTEALKASVDAGSTLLTQLGEARAALTMWGEWYRIAEALKPAASPAPEAPPAAPPRESDLRSPAR